MMPAADTTNILVVDDLPEKILVYRTILDELDLHLIAASSGEEALRAVLQNDFWLSSLMSECREWMDLKRQR